MQRWSKHNSPAIYSKRMTRQRGGFLNEKDDNNAFCRPESTTDFWGDTEGVCHCGLQRLPTQVLSLLPTAPIVCPYSVTTSNVLSENLNTEGRTHILEKCDLHWIVSEPILIPVVVVQLCISTAWKIATSHSNSCLYKRKHFLPFAHKRRILVNS